MSLILRLVLLSSATMIIFIACSKNNDGGANTQIDCTNNTSKSFAANVSPIVQSNCAISSCHAAGSLNGPGPLTNYNQISAASSAIRAAVVSGSMPKNSSLTSTQKASIVCWIDAGAINN